MSQGEQLQGPESSEIERPPVKIESELTGEQLEWVRQFRDCIWAQHEGTHPDKVSEAHDEAFLDFLYRSEKFQHGLVRWLALPGTPSPQDAAKRVPKISQAMEMSASKEYLRNGHSNPEHDPDRPPFPEGRDTAGGWEPLWKKIEEDKVAYLDRYLVHLRYYITSNVSDRGRLLKPVVLLNEIEQPVEVLDVGCSLNLIPKRLALCGEEGFQFEDISVWNGFDDDPVSADILNKLVQSDRFKLGQSLGIDFWDPSKDEMFVDWAKSNSFYPSEMGDETREALFEKLIEVQPEQVDFMEFDAAETDPVVVSQERLYQQFDVVYLCTMLYQLEEKADRVLENAHHWVKPDGLIVVQDFVEMTPDGGMEFAPKEHWQNWEYKVWVKNMRREAEGFRYYFTAENGRADKVILQPALGELALARQLGLVPT